MMIAYGTINIDGLNIRPALKIQPSATEVETDFGWS